MALTELQRLREDNLRLRREVVSLTHRMVKAFKDRARLHRELRAMHRKNDTPSQMQQ